MLARGLTDVGLSVCASKVFVPCAGTSCPGLGVWPHLGWGFQVSKDREGCRDLPLQRFPGSPPGAAGDPGQGEGLDGQSSVTARNCSADSSLLNILERFISDTYVDGCNSWRKESCG